MVSKSPFKGAMGRKAWNQHSLLHRKIHFIGNFSKHLKWFKNLESTEFLLGMKLNDNGYYIQTIKNVRFVQNFLHLKFVLFVKILKKSTLWILSIKKNNPFFFLFFIITFDIHVIFKSSLFSILPSCFFFLLFISKIIIQRTCIM